MDQLSASGPGNAIWSNQPQVPSGKLAGLVLTGPSRLPSIFAYSLSLKELGGVELEVPVWNQQFYSRLQPNSFRSEAVQLHYGGGKTLLLYRQEAGSQLVGPPASREVMGAEGVYIPLTVQPACTSSLWGLSSRPGIVRIQRKTTPKVGP